VSEGPGNGAGGGYRKSGSDWAGSWWARGFGVPGYHHQLDGAEGEPEFAVGRFQARPGATGGAPVPPPRDAFLVWVHLAPTAMGQWHARSDGRDVGVAKGAAFATSVFDLRRSVDLRIRAPFDYLHYYLAGSLLR
jgi:hypothetical protein